MRAKGTIRTKRAKVSRLRLDGTDYALYVTKKDAYSLNGLTPSELDNYIDQRNADQNGFYYQEHI